MNSNATPTYYLLTARARRATMTTTLWEALEDIARHARDVGTDWGAWATGEAVAYAYGIDWLQPAARQLLADQTAELIANAASAAASLREPAPMPLTETPIYAERAIRRLASFTAGGKNYPAILWAVRVDLVTREVRIILKHAQGEARVHCHVGTAHNEVYRLVDLAFPDMPLRPYTAVRTAGQEAVAELLAELLA